MSDLTGEELEQRWTLIHDAAGCAVDWVDDVRGNAPRLDAEADHLTLRLRRTRNIAKRLGSVTNQPMTVGFFGLSQAGKSYLISALASGQNGKLETDFGPQRLDFIDHVNPPGGGKEATGLVTRFSRTASAGPDDFPIELKLFSEADLVKIFTNSYFKDFNHEKFNYEYEDKHIRSKLKEISKRKQHTKVPGVSQDDIVDIWDYLNDRFKSSSKVLSGYYWPTALALAPYLNINDRAELFSILWGEIPEFLDIYIEFSRLLENLSYGSSVYAPLEALVKPTEQGGLSQADSIMNVDMLGRIGTDEDHRIRVRPVLDNEILEPIEVSAAMLAALTVEFIFPLVEKTREPIFEDVDLLDFPGYRGRKDHGSIEEMRSSAEKAGTNPVSELLLRGKVAYLFERYTDSQEMNVLIVCTPSNKQSDVEDVGPVLTEWIQRTQGESADIRANRESGLLWAITMFDLRIGNQLDMSEDLMPVAWNGMMKSSMLEKFGSFSWMQEWLDQQPFNNTFLVRKPGFKVAFLDMEDGKELGIAESSQAQLDAMKRTFASEDNVKLHISDPDFAWDAMMAPNDGGMGRIAEYLQTVALKSVKLERLHEQMQALLHDIVDNRLVSWFMAEGSGEIDKKKKIAQQVLEDIRPRLPLLGEFMASLQMPEELLRSLYLRVEDELPEEVDKADDEAEVSGAISLGGGLLDLDIDIDLSASTESLPEADNTVAQRNSGDAPFAKAAISEWINHLRGTVERQALLRYLGFPASAVEAIVDELVTASNRLRLEETLRTVGAVDQDAIKRDLLVDRQLLAVKTILGDYISWLGFDKLPLEERPNSLANRGAKIFEPPEPINPGDMPALPVQAVNFSGNYLFDWIVAFSQLAQDNAGHSAGREITPDQNQRLGAIIEQFTAS